MMCVGIIVNYHFVTMYKVTSCEFPVCIFENHHVFHHMRGPPASELDQPRLAV